MVGEVKNGASTPVEFVRINAGFYDSAGNVVASDSGYACLDVIPAGGDAPFYILVLDPPSNIARYTLQVDGRATSKQAATGLELSGISTRTDSSGDLHVSGQVTNRSTVTYRFVEICAAYYNAAGDVIRTDSSYARPDTLTPSQSGTFEVEDDGEGVATHRLWVEGDPQ